MIRLAAIVWFAGVLILLFKSSGMFIEAVGIGAPVSLTIGAVAVGLAVGAVKAKFLFVRICRKNIHRIYALKAPKVWQFYRIRFFIFLFLMVSFGNWAYHASKNNFGLLLGLAVLELSISTALLLSATCFKTKLLEEK